MQSNHIDEYVSSGTSPTVRASTSQKSRRRCLNPLPVIRIGRYLRFDWLEGSACQRKQSERAA
jgi:hypothetical protein